MEPEAELAYLNIGWPREDSPFHAFFSRKGNESKIGRFNNRGVIMSDENTVLHHGRIGLAVLLSRDFMGNDQYRSRFSLPVESKAFATERKIVRTGEGQKLRKFLKSPVRTSPDRARPPSRILPKWIYEAVEKYIVRCGRAHRGYTLELIGMGHPSITWRLKRLVSRRAMRYNPVKLLGAKGKRDLYDAAMANLEQGRPVAFASEAENLTIDHWRRSIHFILRLTAFEQERAMESWIARHPRSDRMEPIDRGGARPVLSEPDSAEKGRFWFKSTGWYALPPALLDLMDKDALSFAFSQPSGMRLLKAYFNRGPDNLIFNFFNWPLEAAALHRQQCPPGSVLTDFTCDLRFEVYK